MQDEERERYARKLGSEPLVGADQLGDGLGGLIFIGDERILVHRFDDLGVARKVLVFQLQDPEMRRQVADALQD